MSRNLMIQGTMSNAGKSLLVAGILRVMKQDGYSVAPFKSQNMALNSYITEDGLEMGRAQVMQAEAAGIAPQVCMNPILLKPTSDVGSQVIVHGRVRGNYSAGDYFQMKRSLIPEIMHAYDELQEQADIIVIEGAGSPAEINLKADDIVNMGLAELVDAPVILVGDIDRGGVFAQLLGTVLLLEEEERRRIKGFVINKFRGDEQLLSPGPEMLYERCGIPTLGVLPYIKLCIDDEDSLSDQLVCRNVGSKGTRALVANAERMGRDRTDKQDRFVQIAVIRLPHLSNFTDVNPLAQYSFVEVRYVDGADRLGDPDLIFLPGSKNTIEDMRWLRECGLEKAVLDQVSAGCRLLGICGGYQMLGDKIVDCVGAESGGEIRGMGLLPVTTVFQEQKQRSRITGKVCSLPEEWKRLSDLTLEGYEIHMGECVYHAAGSDPAESAFCILADGRADGCVSGRVLGTYLHGILETELFTRELIFMLGEEKGFTKHEMEGALGQYQSYKAFKESQYDLLADTVRRHLDMEQIYGMIFT